MFSSLLKSYSIALEFPAGPRMSSYAFRRGIAQEILDHGGSLAILLRAGDQCSSAFLSNLRHQQMEGIAAAQTIITMFDSDCEE